MVQLLLLGLKTKDLKKQKLLAIWIVALSVLTSRITRIDWVKPKSTILPAKSICRSVRFFWNKSANSARNQIVKTNTYVYPITYDVVSCDVKSRFDGRPERRHRMGSFGSGMFKIYGKRLISGENEQKSERNEEKRDCYHRHYRSRRNNLAIRTPQW